MICLASATAVRVPCALVLDPKISPPQLAAGTIAP